VGGIGVAFRELHAVELQEDHRKEHDFTFIFALVLIVGEVKIHNAGSINTKAARQLTAEGCIGLDDVVQGGVLELALEGESHGGGQRF